jgi:recombination protein RecR
MEFPQKIKDAVSQLSKLSGIGEKTAVRHVVKMLAWQKSDLNEFAQAIQSLQLIQKCIHCNMISDEDSCDICTNEERLREKAICVVENVNDVIAIERCRFFKGTYFVLNGVLNPLMGRGPKEVGIDQLITRLKSADVDELILAINPSLEGDATCSYIRDIVPREIKVERIGFGMPIGGSIDLLDSMTIAKALENRKNFS